MADSSFRVQTRYVLLTYSQGGELDPWVVHDLIVGYPAECIIGREDHADGGTHLHAFVDFGRRVNIRDPRRFDVEGFHPNIQPCGRTPQKMLDYAIKDGDVVAGGLDPTIDSAVQGSGDVWSRIANAPTVDEFWDLARELAPRALLCNHQSLRAYAEWHYRPEAVAYQHPDTLQLSTAGVPGLDEWVLGRPRSLILWGETRLGKTVWARSLGPHIYCCPQWNVDDLKAGLEDAKYAVLDDIQGNFQFFPSYKGWLGGQSTFTVTDKYRGKTTIQWGRPTIWLMNDDPEEVGHVDLNWLRGNCDIIHLTDTLLL
ncbi:replication-associated protein [Pacific flying fox faeces associated gemycircularvirus-1]|uniref:Replication-associated protein n=1 Tax=Pacific flying fox faeces associated gemycircularvirus-1 TaxID=1795988 RepID=A0A140CTK6_9VIRU|nr:replication-associated protein [Pacific flying fox faeces associated gemycircularvirus-1]